MFVVWSKDSCPNCVKAVALLTLHGREFEVKKIGTDISLEDFKTKYPTVGAVPLITKDSKTWTLISLKLHLKEIRNDF